MAKTETEVAGALYTDVFLWFSKARPFEGTMVGLAVCCLCSRCMVFGGIGIEYYRDNDFIQAADMELKKRFCLVAYWCCIAQCS